MNESRNWSKELKNNSIDEETDENVTTGKEEEEEYKSDEDGEEMECSSKSDKESTSNKEPIYDVNEMSVKELEQHLKITCSSNSDSDKDFKKALQKEESNGVDEDTENEDRTDTQSKKVVIEDKDKKETLNDSNEYNTNNESELENQRILCQNDMLLFRLEEAEKTKECLRKEMQWN